VTLAHPFAAGPDRPGRASPASQGRPGNPDLEADLAAALMGSTEAFERIYRALAGPVAGYLRLHGVADVEGLANEVMAQVHRNLGRFDGDGPSFRSWVFTIAHHRMVDERRRASRRPAPADGELPESAAVGDAELDALDLLGDERVQQLLSVLSTDQRAVLLLRVVADLSVEDVAEALGKRPGAIKALQHRALAALRRHLDRVGAPT
jgi:RNA polymerase sigma factor (sigma-70 family)